MAVKIRLKRMGAKNRPFFRLVAAEESYQRDGRFLEVLGYYDPLQNPSVIEIKEDLVIKWLKQGAQLSENAKSLLRQKGILASVKAAAKTGNAPKEESSPASPSV